MKKRSTSTSLYSSTLVTPVCRRFCLRCHISCWLFNASLALCCMHEMQDTNVLYLAQGPLAKLCSHKVFVPKLQPKTEKNKVAEEKCRRSKKRKKGNKYCVDNDDCAV